MTSTTARAIHVDKPAIREIAKELELVIAKALAHREGPIGKMTFGQYPHEVRAVDGSKRDVWILLRAIESDDFRAIVGGGLGTVRGQAVVVVHVNGSLDAESLRRSATSHLMQTQLYPVLLHELTHAADMFDVGPGVHRTEQELRDNPGIYYNNPSELRAYMQEVVDELTDFFRHYEKLRKSFGNRAMKVLLERSPTWNQVSPHWTRQNQNKVMKSVSQALEQWQDDQVRKVADLYLGTPSRVAARYLQAKASLDPAIRELGKGNKDLEAVREALLALDVRPNGDRWSIEADWFYGLGPRNYSRAKTVITSLGHLVGYPDKEVDPSILRTIAFELKWLEKAKGTSPSFTHGSFEVTPLGVTGPQVKGALEGLDAAAKTVRSKFPKLLYGKVFVTKTLPNSHTAVAKYAPDGDVIYLSLKAKKTTGDVYALCHELGHRYDVKFWKDKKQRAEFDRLSVMPEYGSIVFDAALRKKLADEFMVTIENQKEGRPSSVSDLLSKWLDHHFARNLPRMKTLSQQAVKGDDKAARELWELVVGDDDVTIRTDEVVRKPLHVTEYGKKSPRENFAEAFAHFVLGMSMPAEIAAIMTELK